MITSLVNQLSLILFVLVSLQCSTLFWCDAFITTPAALTNTQQQKISLTKQASSKSNNNNHSQQQQQQQQQRSYDDTCSDTSTVIAGKASRRDFISSVMIGTGAATTLLLHAERVEADEDLASQLFNPDGSLKEGVESEAKERLVEFKWDLSDTALLNEDGVNLGSTVRDGSEVKISYKYPAKWSDGSSSTSGGDEIYFDRSDGMNKKACKRISVYQAPGIADVKRLEKASITGVAKALSIPEEFKRLYNADIISGKVSTDDSNGQTYYEFDMAAAPETCGSSNENLGLGFCPYDNIFLLSATIVKDRLVCIIVECDDSKVWKLASSKLKRVRSSFRVEEL